METSFFMNSVLNSKMPTGSHESQYAVMFMAYTRTLHEETPVVWNPDFRAGEDQNFYSPQEFITAERAMLSLEKDFEKGDLIIDPVE